VTIVTWGKTVHVVLEAAKQLEADRSNGPKGIDAEIIDLRTMRPLDTDTVIQSVVRTHRCVVVHEAWPLGGIGAEIADRVQREAFDSLDAPVERVTGADVPMPYAHVLEKECLPTPERVIAAVRKALYV